MWLGPPALPLYRPLRGDFILGQTLPRAHMHLAETVIDPRFDVNQPCKRSRRRQRPPQRTRHDRADILSDQHKCHRFGIWLRGGLDAHVEPPHHTFLGVPYGAPMTHEVNQSHSAV